MNKRVETMVNLMAAISGYTAERIMAPTRKFPICYLRYCIYYALAKEGWSTNRIGKEFGKDHSSITHGISRVRDLETAGNTYGDIFEYCKSFIKRIKIQTDMKKIYISGPIGGRLDAKKREERYAWFKDKENYYKNLGYEIANPMDNGLPADATEAQHMDADFQMIRECDAILMLEGWNRSGGCKTELDYAMAIGKEVYVEKAQTLE